MFVGNMCQKWHTTVINTAITGMSVFSYVYQYAHDDALRRFLSLFSAKWNIMAELRISSDPLGVDRNMNYIINKYLFGLFCGIDSLMKKQKTKRKS